MRYFAGQADQPAKTDTNSRFSLLHLRRFCKSFYLKFRKNIGMIYMQNPQKSPPRRAAGGIRRYLIGVGREFLVKNGEDQVGEALLIHGQLQVVFGADGPLAGGDAEDVAVKAHGGGLGGQVDDAA